MFSIFAFEIDTVVLDLLAEQQLFTLRPIRMSAAYRINAKR